MVELRQPVYLKDTNRVYTCKSCHAHLLPQDAIVSRAFQGRHGQAFLVDRLINVTAGVREERMLLTGMHIIADVSCTICASKIGWKYVLAYEKAQKYKENKFIVEKAKVAKEIVWDTNGNASHCYDCGVTM